MCNSTHQVYSWTTAPARITANYVIYTLFSQPHNHTFYINYKITVNT